jgi:predicted nucleotidyltransferase
MIHGLNDLEYEYIFNNLIGPLKKAGCSVFLFGSRANKKNKKYSDIDLLYTVHQKNDSEIERLIFKLMAVIDESKFPYKIDLVKNEELAASFRTSVDTEKIEL